MSPEVQKQLLEVVASVLIVPVNELDTEATMNDIPAWDSLKHMNLISELESVYKVTFEMNEIMAMRSIIGILNTLTLKGI